MVHLVAHVDQAALDAFGNHPLPAGLSDKEGGFDIQFNDRVIKSVTPTKIT